jgi:5-methyltetrahydrofolate--homocysteine methyltransferase
LHRNIKEMMRERILILDGAMGTLIQKQNLTEEDFGGYAYEGCNEFLNLTRPDVISGIHSAYLAAGADIIETNTFGATAIVLSEYGLESRTEEINVRAAELARQAANQYATEEWPRFVAGAMGPTTKSLSVTGGATFSQLVDAYRQQAAALIRGSVDLLLLETSQDTLNVKAASRGIMQAFEALGTKLPVIISGTIEPMGTTLAGQSIEALYLSVEHLEPIAVGLNCATGPEFMRDHVRDLSALSAVGVSCYPNAGLPDENGHYHETPAAFAEKIADFVSNGWVNVVGGCCGTTPEHIKALRVAVADKPPRIYGHTHGHAVSGLEPLILDADNRPILVGERTNVIGSRKFKKLIKESEFDAAAEVARTQVRAGAQVVDVCLADPDRDEATDMERLLPKIARKIKVPLMIDSTDASVIELALHHIQGKSIINSTNLEDGEARFSNFARLARQYGTALVIGTIDEQGMAVTRERKLEVAERSIRLLVEKYGVKVEDIIIDPLTFPVGTGDEKYIGSAKETVEGIRLIKQHFPLCPIILGVSNISFGLSPAGREVLNSVFLYECTKAGLDYAIVNTEKLQRYASIPAAERELAERLLYDTSDEIVAEFTAFYRTKSPRPVEDVSTLSLDERLVRYVVEGRRDGLIDDLNQALVTRGPLAIINGPLMAGMNEVGKLFNNNELIVAEVLQSAEVMKVAVSHLEHFMEKDEGQHKGKILLATVKGDVHDIGKNLVEIILANNGYEVVNLGIKVPPDQLIEACKRENPDMIGLSGLLVKSAQQMVVTAEDLQHAGIHVPLFVGGAALTKKFTFTRIKPKYSGPLIYSKDAMEGLDFANRLMNPATYESLIRELRATEEEMLQRSTEAKVGSEKAQNSPGMSLVRRDQPIFAAPDLKRHVFRKYSLAQIRPYLNLQMLLGKHMGLAGNVEKLIAERDEKAISLLELMDELLEMGEREGILEANAVYQFFPAQAVGDEVRIYDASGEHVLERFQFPRQRKSPFLCLADFVRPEGSGERDFVAFFTVTTGKQIRQVAEAWKERGDYLRSHAIQALALELAEAFAERLHHIIRDSWGFPDRADLTMRERFTAKYQGIRVSFGYPACPNLEDQIQLFRLLKPEDIGVQLTDGYMMDPESSVSAMVFAHPEARYFNVEA